MAIVTNDQVHEICHVMIKPSGIHLAQVIGGFLTWVCETWQFQRSDLIIPSLDKDILTAIYPVAKLNPEWFVTYTEQPTIHSFIIGRGANTLIRSLRGERTEPWEPLGRGIRAFLREIHLAAGAIPDRFDDYIHVSETSADAERTWQVLKTDMPLMDVHRIHAILEGSAT